MMTRQTFKAMARAIREARNPDPEEIDSGRRYGRDETCNEIAEQMARIFAADNPRFDRARFLEATQPTDREVDIRLELVDAVLRDRNGEPDMQARIDYLESALNEEMNR